MNTRMHTLRLLLLSAIVLVFSCSEDSAGPQETGFISVQVVDLSTDTPVPDVEVSIAGANQVSKTNPEGVARFEIAAGSYYVDAQVCCVGPGFIEHHVGVKVLAGKTVGVQLDACLLCL